MAKRFRINMDLTDEQFQQLVKFMNLKVDFQNPTPVKKIENGDGVIGFCVEEVIEKTEAPS